MSVPSLPQPIDAAEAAKRRQLAAIAARVRVSQSLATVLAEAAFGHGDVWPFSAGASR